MIFRPTIAQINLDALLSNYRVFKALNQNQFFCPMIKANAYGHGDIEVAKLLANENPSALGVGLIEEGVRIREAGVKAPVLFFGVINKASVGVLAPYSITPVISDWEQLTLVKEAYANTGLNIHLKMNTGMHRYGFAVTEAEKLNDTLKQLPGLRIQGLMTHLASGEDFGLKDSFSQNQVEQFLQAYKRLDVAKLAQLHLFNSNGLASYSHSSLSRESSSSSRPPFGSRPGIGLYGYLPLIKSLQDRLTPALSLASKVVHVSMVKSGETVSYGRSWTAKRASVIGVIPLGYADGLPRALSNRGRVLIGGQFVPIVGNVTMDNIMIDLTDLNYGREPANYMDQEIILLGRDSGGREILATEWAAIAHTIEWEILTSISERVPRIFKGGTPPC